jgi:glycosyltransferase involved in cell wall biosynthesis
LRDDLSEFVAVTPYGPKGASARVRVFDWLQRVAPDAPVLSYVGAQNNAPSTLVTRPLSVVRAELRLRALSRSKPGRLLLHRAASPFGGGGLEGKLLRSADWSVYDFDDALQWDSEYKGVSRLVGSNPSTCIRAIRGCDRVIAGNDVLADWAGQFARNVVIIPSCVDPEMYVTKKDYNLSDPPRLVWVGSSSAEKHLVHLENALLEANHRWGVRLIVIGHPVGKLGRLDSVIDRIPWGLGVSELDLCKFDVGVAPLDDDIYSRGKCAYKLVQYGAAALPFVASPVGANATVGSSLGGRLAVTTDDWLGQLSEILSMSSEARRELGVRGRLAVQNSFSFEAWESSWTEVLGIRQADASDQRSRNLVVPVS